MNEIGGDDGVSDFNNGLLPPLLEVLFKALEEGESPLEPVFMFLASRSASLHKPKNC